MNGLLRARRNRKAVAKTYVYVTDKCMKYTLSGRQLSADSSRVAPQVFPVPARAVRLRGGDFLFLTARISLIHERRI